MQNWPDARCYWLALYLVPGLGNVTLKRLVERFGGPREVFRADLKELLAVEGMRRQAAHALYRGEFSADPEAELKAVERCGARVVTYHDRDYPDVLREIHGSPMVIYLRGNVPSWSQTWIAVVGSRSATDYGLRMAGRIGKGLASHGIGVVSGMARGIDAAAHWGCIGAGGYTLAVLGTGVDVPYPRSNINLMEKILEQGTVVSEFPMGTPPDPRHFPIRNRLISGLCQGVVVVEATRRSGSLITAAQALDQGREVFAVPGSVDSIRSKGTHFLLKQGAKLVEGVEDILEELRPGSWRVEAPAPAPRRPAGLDRFEEAVYGALGVYPLHIDEIARKARLRPGEASGAVMTLELKGIAKQLPGRCYIRS